MNKEIEKYINDEVEKFRNELTSKVDAILEKENKSKSVWDIEKGDVYYFIGVDGEINSFDFTHHCFDIEARENGNIFLAREEAEFELERRKVEAVMRKYSRPFEEEKIIILFIMIIASKLYLHLVGVITILEFTTSNLKKLHKKQLMKSAKTD